LGTYLEMFNAYNRNNVAIYYRNEVKNEQDKMLQWTLIPVGGIEYEL